MTSPLAFQRGHSSAKLPLRSYPVAYILSLLLLVFSVRTTFSFESGSGNVTLGGKSVGIVQTMSDTDTLQNRIQLGFVLSITALLIAKRGRQVMEEMRRNKVITLSAVLALASTAWSQEPARTALFATYLALDILFAFYLVSRFTPDELLRLFSVTGVLAVLSSICMALLLPKYGIDFKAPGGPWQGLFTHKNACAIELTFFLCAMLFSTARGYSKIYRLLFIAAAVGTIIKTQSRTGWLGVGLLLLFAASFHILKRFPRKDQILLAIIIVAAGGALISLSVDYFPQALTVLGKDSTMSGRTSIWYYVLLSIWKRPLLGYGFSAFWLGMKGESANVITGFGFLQNHAQNGLLDVWLQTGAIGMAIVVIWLFQALRNAVRTLRPQSPNYVGWYLGVLLMTLFYNIGERTLLVPDDLSFIVMVVAAAGLATEARRLGSVQGHAVRIPILARQAG